MKKFAYLDKTGILHITKNKATAIKYSSTGKFVVTEGEAKFGYPIVDGEGVIVYSPTEMKISAEGQAIVPIKDLALLYTSCI